MQGEILSESLRCLGGHFDVDQEGGIPRGCFGMSYGVIALVERMDLLLVEGLKFGAGRRSRYFV